MSQTPLTDAYLASRCKGENKQSWVEFARGLEEKLVEWQRRAESMKEPEPHSWSLLRLDGVDGPVFFVMEERYGNPNEEDYQGHREYFYEEHSCPTNWLDDCVAVIEDGDDDPHGFLTFVRSTKIPDPIPTSADAPFEPDWSAIFPEAFAPK